MAKRSVVMAGSANTSCIGKIKLTDFKWLNEPKTWTLKDNVLEFVTGNSTDFWQGTHYNFNYNSGHVFGVDVKDDFTMTAYVDANFRSPYDQAGLMIYVDEKHWVKAGFENHNGRTGVSSVVTNEKSDLGTGVLDGSNNIYCIRVTKVKDVICIKYSTNNATWHLLRLAHFPEAEKYFVGPYACTPTREGLSPTFKGIRITEPHRPFIN